MNEWSLFIVIPSFCYLTLMKQMFVQSDSPLQMSFLSLFLRTSFGLLTIPFRAGGVPRFTRSGTRSRFSAEPTSGSVTQCRLGTSNHKF